MSGLGSLVKSAKAARKGEPFFSAVDEAAQALTRGKGTGKEFMTELIKVKGVKPTEIKERGLQKIEAMPKMTKEQFLQELEKRPAPQVRETGYAEEPDQEAFSDAFRKAVGHLPENKRMRAWFDMPEKERNKLLASAEARNIYEPGTKYEKWQMPGGSNYREILLKLPRRGLSEKEVSDKMYLEATARRGTLSPEQQAKLDDLTQRQQSAPSPYVSSHWKEDPNVLAHIRVSDREGPNGEQILHVEEIQSDWHQAGRKKGYGDTVNEQGHFTVGVPDAPFKKNWHELAMKRVLNYAADKGYDKVVITPGAEQASRYDLSKHIDEISYGKNPDGTYSLTAIDKNGKPAISNMKLSESDLENTVGKEIAEKIIQGQGAEFPAGSVSEGKKALSGLDLQVGGEGMKGFYDKILPDYLNNFGKKYGVQVEMENYPIKVTDDLNFPVETSEANGLPSFVPGEQRMVHSFNITPEMRQDITGKGLPLYQQIGIPTAGAAAGAEALQTEEPSYAVGGAVGGEYDTSPDMADGGRMIQGSAFKKGGRVHLTDNPDTMLLDLLSRN